MARFRANFKIVLMGDGMVGKTSLAKRYLGKGFDTKYLRTLGVDFYIKETAINHPMLGQVSINWTIWDLGGQYVWKDVRPIYYKGAKGGILVFDVARPVTFTNTKYWLYEFIKNAGKGHPVVLVGNKVDLRDEGYETINSKMGEELAKEFSKYLDWEVKYIESSAKTGLNVKEVFEFLGIQILDKLIEEAKKKRQI